MEEKTFYQEVIEAGIICDNHFSDLYIPKNEETTKLLKKCNKVGYPFIDQITGAWWYDVPFAYDPFFYSNTI